MCDCAGFGYARVVDGGVLYVMRGCGDSSTRQSTRWFRRIIVTFHSDNDRLARGSLENHRLHPELAVVTNDFQEVNCTAAWWSSGSEL